jgi:hypothetical protein
MSEEQTPEQAAQVAAEQWLAAVDRGDAATTYATAAELFRQAVTPEQWTDSLVRVQKPIGHAITRALRSSRYTTELPGAPDGEYALFEYATEFEHKKNGTETVVMMREASGAWCLSGYWIR